MVEIASDGVCRLNIMYPDTGFLIPFSDKLGHYLRLERAVFSGTSFIPTLSGSFRSISVHLHLQAERSASAPVVDFSTCPLSFFFVKAQRKERARIKTKKKPRHSLGGGLKMDRTCWRGKWVEWDAPLVSCVTVWVCLSCLTAEGNKLLKSFRLSVSLHFCHFQTPTLPLITTIGPHRPLSDLLFSNPHPRLLLPTSTPAAHLWIYRSTV